jgi:hypothetical protein
MTELGSKPSRSIPLLSPPPRRWGGNKAWPGLDPVWGPEHLNYLNE